jgi:hypothetical protein
MQDRHYAWRRQWQYTIQRVQELVDSSPELQSVSWKKSEWYCGECMRSYEPQLLYFSGRELPYADIHPHSSPS